MFQGKLAEEAFADVFLVGAWPPANFSRSRVTPDMQVEHRTLVKARPETLFRIYADVANWNKWDPDTKASHIDGPFAEGARGQLTPARGNTVPMLLTSVRENRCFTVESRIPLFRMVFEHELVARDEGTEVIHRVSFHGLLAPVLGRLVGARVDKGLPVTLANLKARAEMAAAVDLVGPGRIPIGADRG